jgi:hypothetical protein
MEGLADTWESCNSMLYTHNWWHVALYYFSLGNFERVLDLYDTQIWGHASNGSGQRLPIPLHLTEAALVNPLHQSYGGTREELSSRLVGE